MISCTTSAFRSIDLADLNPRLLASTRTSAMTWRRHGEITRQVHIQPVESGLWLDRQFVRYTWTEMNFGNRRRWLSCPCCERRVRVLYDTRNGFACRKCLGLLYESQLERPMFRALAQAQKIAVRLGGTGCIDDGLPARPKGMHRRTYRRLAERFNRLAGQAEGLMQAYLAHSFGAIEAGRAARARRGL